MRRLAILGSTGSVGLSTLDVVARHRADVEVVALTANTNDVSLYEQCLTVKPSFAVMVQPESGERLRQRLRAVGCKTEVLIGTEALNEIAAHPAVDTVMAAIVGGAGLLSTFSAVKAGKRVLLANKESLVMMGQLLMEIAKSNGAQILPIDSEHNAIFQCMPTNFLDGLEKVGVDRIILTASGGPFLSRANEDLSHVTPEEACAHPNWSMGRKISVDSSTMMNKGLEIIEACWLFGTSPEDIEVVVHPQSVVHSMVRYVDGSVLAQLGNPDMRTPIAHALFWPQRRYSGVAPLNMLQIGELTFQTPCMEQFPCLRLCFEAARGGINTTISLNAANEVAVAAFLEQRIRYTDIARVIEDTLTDSSSGELISIDAIVIADALARENAEKRVLTLQRVI